MSVREKWHFLEKNFKGFSHRRPWNCWTSFGQKFCHLNHILMPKVIPFLFHILCFTLNGLHQQWNVLWWREMLKTLELKCILNLTRINNFGRSPVLVVMGGDSCSEGHGFESHYRISKIDWRIVGRLQQDSNSDFQRSGPLNKLLLTIIMRMPIRQCDQMWFCPLLIKKQN